MLPAPIDGSARPQLPDHWPKTLHPSALAEIDHPTPYLITDLDAIADGYRRLTAALPGVSCFYAMKCNSTPEVLRTLAAVGAGFEVASQGELQALQAIGVDAGDVLYSNPIKPSAHIAAAHRAGLWRFSFDSEGELRKLAEHAPGAAVYLRLGVNDSTSTFPLSRKFGADADDASALVLLARSLGLRPYGITFHVGSQCATTSAWPRAIAVAGQLMGTLAEHGIRLEMLNLGGGFPAQYVEPVPTIGEIAEAVWPALDGLLPYRPATLAVEPGRHLVAESAVLTASVLGREERAGENWVYLDVGAYNGLMETVLTVEPWHFPLWTSRADHAVVPHVPFTVSGPTCDSTDTMFRGIALPSTLQVDDKVYIGSAGAYTLSYASSFNGFAPPTTLFLGG